MDQPEDSLEDSTIDDDLSIDVFDRGSPSDAPKSDSAWLSFGSMTISELEPGRQYKAQCRIKDNVVAPPVYFSTKHQGIVLLLLYRHYGIIFMSCTVSLQRHRYNQILYITSE